MSDTQPVIIGVGDVVNRSKRKQDAIEPIDLMLQAIQVALQDAMPHGTDNLKTTIDSIDVVNTWTWKYDDLPRQIADRLGVRARHLHNSPDGGNQPVKLLDDACRRIVNGETQVALLTGGEALASLNAFAAEGDFPPESWTPLKGYSTGFPNPPESKKEGAAEIHNIGLPIHVYPLYEHGLRSHLGQTPRDNHEESAKLYAEFAKIASVNTYAWAKGNQETAQSIATVSRKNRMICSPYPLLMNALNTVNLTAAVLLTSVGHAKRLGIPQEKLVYVLGAAGCSDSEQFWLRPNFYSSPAISLSLDGALKSSQCKVDNIDLFDFYSCFPIVPKLACRHLGIPVNGRDKPITLLGGLTSFGGAGNNYSMHAVTEMSRQLRNKTQGTGLILANGGVVSYQHAAVLSSRPREEGSYPTTAVLPPYTVYRAPNFIQQANGEASIETYTVEYDREKPATGHIVGRLMKTGDRFLAHADSTTLKILSDVNTECIGLTGTVKAGPEGVNTFTLSRFTAKL